MNVATAMPTARYTALLVESDKNSGLENALREHGCSVRRATSRAAAQDALEGADLVIVTTQGLSEGDVTELVGKAILSSAVLVITADESLALKAAKLGAATSIGSSAELASAHIGQQIGIIELKKKFARQSGIPSSMSAPNSGVVQRRSTPLPKEATPDALEALVEAAEMLVPMHRFQRVYVDYALRRFGGNKVHTAAALGIDRRTIQRWARARSEQPQSTQPQTTTHS